MLSLVRTLLCAPPPRMPNQVLQPPSKDGGFFSYPRRHAARPFGDPHPGQDANILIFYAQKQNNLEYYSRANAKNEYCELIPPAAAWRSSWPVDECRDPHASGDLRPRPAGFCAVPQPWSRAAACGTPPSGNVERPGTSRRLDHGSQSARHMVKLPCPLPR